MANMIIENILNKEDYYERLKKENQVIIKINLGSQRNIVHTVKIKLGLKKKLLE